MKTRHVVRTTRPIQGPVAFVRAAALWSLGACDATTHPVIPTSHQMLARDEDQLHPGEASA